MLKKKLPRKNLAPKFEYRRMNYPKRFYVWGEAFNEVFAMATEIERADLSQFRIKDI